MDKQIATKIISQFDSKRILVIGDIILDTYLWCTVNRISPEAPVPVALVEKETSTLGGAANVVNNLRALDVQVDVIGLIGDDTEGRKILEHFKKAEISTDGVFVQKGKRSITKTRIMCNNQQLIRVDNEDVSYIGKRIEKQIIEHIEKKSVALDGIIIEDYAKGLLSKGVIKKIIDIGVDKNIPVFVDPTTTTVAWYKHVFLMKPNKKEAEHFLHQKIKTDATSLEKAVKKIKKYTAAHHVVTTLGKDGMAILDDKDIFVKLHTHTKDVYDVSGAGDTTIATIAAAMVSGATLLQAGTLGNIGASIVVEKLGTAVCTRQELLDRMSKYD